MNARNHFKIASLTKSYTATVVLQLVAEGKLHLTDSVERWLPGLVPNGEHITLRQLLNHIERARRLRVRSPLPQAVPERKPRLLLGAAPAREDGRLAPAAVPARRHQAHLLLEHELRPARPRRRGGHAPTRSARSCAAASSGPCTWTTQQLPDDEARSAAPLRARLHGRRQAAGDRRHRPQPVALAGLRCDRLHRRRRPRLLPRAALRASPAGPIC